MQSIASLKQVAQALGGNVSSGQVLFPGPKHSARDRSCSLRLSPAAPDGFIVESFAGDDWRDVRDHVRSRLGIASDAWKRRSEPRRQPSARVPAQSQRSDDDAGVRAALSIWEQSVSLCGTQGELYLRRDRGLDTSEDLSNCLRWHEARCALIALFRDIKTDAPRAISRILLDEGGHKIARKFLGPVGGCAIKIDRDEDVTLGLHVGEGLETCLAARTTLGFKPTWALGSAGAIAKLPVIAGIEVLTILGETDDGGANGRAIEEVGGRWFAAGREIYVVDPKTGDDLNSALMGRAA